MEIITKIPWLLLLYWPITMGLIMKYFDNKRLKKRFEKDYPEIIEQIKELKKQKSL